MSDPRTSEDGLLHPAEMVQLKLHSALAILSACDTAVGPVEGEEGIETLSRAFLLAGARNVISPLWSVDDTFRSPWWSSFTAIWLRVNLGRRARWRKARPAAQVRFSRSSVLLGSRAVRAKIHEAVTPTWCGIGYWLDIGNNAASEQFVLGQPLNRAIN
jgi:CHAT domain